MVDQSLRSSDPLIHAAGDLANAYHPLYGTHLRVDDRLPYFYTDQYDLGMEYTGSAPAGGYDTVVVRGDRDKREFVAFWSAGGRVAAGMSVNVWEVTDDIEALIRSGMPVDLARLADPGVALADLIPSGMLYT